jgi:hypothetical protein
MRGLPDSAIYGTYKRMSRVGGRRRRVSHGDDFFELLYWIIYFIKWAKARRKK